MIIYKLRFYKISKLPYESMKVGWLKILQSGINMKLLSLSLPFVIFSKIYKILNATNFILTFYFVKNYISKNALKSIR